MGVGGRGARRGVFILAQKLAQLLGSLFPFRRRVAIEDTRQCPPACVAGKLRLLCAARVTTLRLDILQDPDRLEVAARLFPQAAFANAVRTYYAEVAGAAGAAWLGIEVPDDDRAVSSSLGRKAHSRVASSHAA